MTLHSLFTNRLSLGKAPEPDSQDKCLATLLAEDAAPVRPLPLVSASPEWRETLLSYTRSLWPALLTLTLSTAAHAQGTIDFSGATTLMTTVKVFAIFAGAIICFISLIFAGIKMMSGRFEQAIPGLGGALFGAGVLGWGAGWIRSLTGQSGQ